MQKMLQHIANAFGLDVTVKGKPFSYAVEAKLKVPTVITGLDEDRIYTNTVFAQPDDKPARSPLFDLLYMEVERMQEMALIETSKAFQAVDRRQRVLLLSKEDKHTLNLMLRDAENEVHSRQCGYSNESYAKTQKTCDEYRALVGKLMR